MIDDSVPVTLMVRGYGFTVASVVLWDGVALPTTFVDGLTLQAQVATAVIGPPRSVLVTVNNVALTPATVQVVENLQQVYLPIITK
jgi:hypothetical protein